MRMNGWMRLWIVLGVLWAIPVALLGYDMRPKLDHINSSWVYEATDEIAARISAKEGQEISGYRIREAIRERHATDELVIDWLQQMAAKPKLSQTTYAESVQKINQKYRERISGHPAELRAYAFKAFLVWLAPLLTLLALGFATGWIWRGFRTKPISGG